MKKKLLKSIITFTGIVAIAAIVLVAHLQQVKKPTITSPAVIALTRIDFKQSLSDANMSHYYEWFNKQRGVNRIVFNTQSHNAVLAYHPAVVHAPSLIKAFFKKFDINGQQFIPSKSDLMQGCPVALK